MPKDIFNHLVTGKFALALNAFARRCPAWLFRFNKAAIMFTETFRFPEKLNPAVKVKIANESDVDDIIRITGVKAEHILNMMKAGAVCFISQIDNEPPACVSWSANGRTFVRGMGFFYDLGPDGYYSYGTVTAPEARGKGHYLCVESEKIKYELERGAKRFYGLIEFTNTYSYSLQEKLGYHPILDITYLKLLGLKYCRIKDLIAGKRSHRLFVRIPENDTIVI